MLTFTPEGITIFPALLLMLLLAVLMPRRSHMSGARSFRGFLACSALFLAALFVELVGEEPLRRYASAFQYPVLIITLAMLTQFAYTFSVPPRPHEPLIAAGCYGLAFTLTILCLFPYLRPDNPSDVPLQWMGLIIFAAFSWPVIVFFRQARRRRRDDPDRGTARAFALVLLLPAALSLAAIMFELRLIERLAYHTLNSTGILLFVALLAEVFVRWYRRVAPGEPLLVGLWGLRALAVVIVLCGAANTPLISWYWSNYQRACNDAGKQAVAALRDSASATGSRLPASIGFVITLSPTATTRYTRVGPVPVRRVLREFAALEQQVIAASTLTLQEQNPSLDHDVGRLLARRTVDQSANTLGVNPVILALYLGAPEPQYHYVTLWMGGEHYLVSFPYANYRAYLNQVMGRQAIAVLGISLVATGLIVGHSLLRRTRSDA